MNDGELASIIQALGKRGPDEPTLWVGYNRRFATLSQKAMEHMAGVAVRQVSCTIRKASTAGDSWYQDPN